MTEPNFVNDPELLKQLEKSHYRKIKLGRYEEFLLALKDRPNEWAILKTLSGNDGDKRLLNIAANIRSGTTAGSKPKKSYVCKLLKTDGSTKWTLYVKYVGSEVERLPEERKVENE